MLRRIGSIAPAAEKVVRFVDKDLVRQPDGATQRHEHLKQCLYVLTFFGVRDFREVDDDADVRVAERAHEFTRLRRWVIAAEGDDTRKRFERAIVAFRIDDAEAVALQNRLLAEQAGEPRFAGAGFAGDQNRPPSNGEAHLGAVGLTTEGHMSPAHLAGRQTRLL